MEGKDLGGPLCWAIHAPSDVRYPCNIRKDSQDQKRTNDEMLTIMNENFDPSSNVAGLPLLILLA